jgi:hypothetical protein
MKETPLMFRMMLVFGGVALLAAVVALWRGEQPDAPSSGSEFARTGTRMTGTSALSHGGSPTSRSDPDVVSRTQLRIGQLVVVSGLDAAGAGPIPLLPGPEETASVPGQQPSSRTVPPGTVAVLKSLRGSYSEIALTNGETGWLPHALLSVPDHLPDKEAPND